MNPTICGVSSHQQGSSSHRNCIASKAHKNASPQSLSITSALIPATTVAHPNNKRAIQQAQAAFQNSGHSLEDWIHARWKELNETDPMVQIQSIGLLGSQYQESITTSPQAIEVSKIAGVSDADNKWGHVNNRPESMYKIGSILEGGSIDEWQQIQERPDIVHSLALVGPNGPLYESGNGGRHRMVMAKTMGIDTMTAQVSDHVAMPIGQSFAVRPEQGRPGWRAHIPEGRIAHLMLLRDAGLIDMPDIQHDHVDNHGKVLELFGCPWVLESPAVVVAIANRYKQSYPDFGNDNPAHQAMLDGHDWMTFLHQRARDNISSDSVNRPSVKAKPFREFLRMFFE